MRSRMLVTGALTFVLAALGAATPSDVPHAIAAVPVAPPSGEFARLASSDEADLQSAISLETAGSTDADSLGGYWADQFQQVATAAYRDPSAITPYLTGDVDPGACAAPPDVAAFNAIYCPVDDSISYDLNWLRILYGPYGRVAPMTVLAHEFGHHLQTLAGAALIPKRRELQADCYAGMYLRHLVDAGLLTDPEITDGLGLISRLGDDPSSASQWTDPNVHGLSNQRREAFGLGYSSADAVYCLAFNAWADQPPVALLGDNELLVAPGSDPVMHEDGSIVFTLPRAHVYVWIIPEGRGVPASDALRADVRQYYAADADILGVQTGWLDAYGWGTGEGASASFERRDADGVLVAAGEAALQIDPSGEGELFVAVVDDPTSIGAGHDAKAGLLGLLWGYCDPEASDPANCPSSASPVPTARPTAVPVPTHRPVPSRRQLEKLLLDLTPTELQPWCKAFRGHPNNNPLTQGALAAVDCWVEGTGISDLAGLQELALYVFEDTDSLYAYHEYRYEAAVPPLTGDSGGCWNGRRGETTWAHGRIACWVTNDPDLPRHAHIRWTDDRANLYGILDATNSDLSGLFDRWIRYVPR